MPEEAGPSILGPLKGFGAELRDAVSPTTAVDFLGPLIVELTFVLSFIGAFHSPKPTRIPIAVAGPAGKQTQVIGCLNRLPGRPVTARSARGTAEGHAMVLHGDVAAVLVLSPSTATDQLLVA